MKDAVIAKLAALLEGTENISTIRGQVREIRDEYSNLKRSQWQELFEKFKEENRGKTNADGEEVKFKAPEDPLDAEFEALYDTYKQRLTAYNEQRAAELAEKMKQKAAILEELKGFASNVGDNIAAAFDKFNGIQEKWKSIGKMPLNEKYKELMMEYSHQCDVFFHNINVVKEMRAVDLQKNLEAKTGILEKIKALLPLENIRTMETELKRLQKAFNEVGQVPFEVKDKIYQEFRETGDAVFAKIQAFYDDRREGLRENLKKKIALCEEAHQIAQESNNLTKPFEWQEITKKVIALQKQWKAIGYSEENEKVWDIFRNACDAFFDGKKAFFQELDKGREQNKVQKLALIEKAEAEKHNTDWRNTTDFFIQLQKEWKKVGSAPRSEENKLWERFRAACDVFFDAKKAFFATAEEKEAGNLKLKEALVERIKAYELQEDVDANFEALKNFAKEFNEIGFVPIKDKDTIYQSYKKALDAKYSELKVDRKEKNKLRLEGELEALLGAQDADRKINQERRKIRNRIDELQSEISQYENNLGFFKGKSKGNKPNPFLKQVEDKLRGLRAEMNEQKTKLRMLPKPEKTAKAE